jgi:hypothetical protein
MLFTIATWYSKLQAEGDVFDSLSLGVAGSCEGHLAAPEGHSVRCERQGAHAPKVKAPCG